MLENVSFTPPIPLDRIGYCGCRFHQEQFTEFAFERYGVHQPATLFNALAQRKSEFLAGRYCSGRALVNLFGRDYRVAVNEDRSPKWPNGIVGSITHHNGHAAAVVAGSSDYSGLGIDFESLLPFIEAQQMLEHILTDRDMACEEIRQCGTRFFVTLAFSAKESLYKALYPVTGQRMGFHDLYIKRVGTNSLTLSLLKTLGPAWSNGADFEVFYTKYNSEVFTLASLAPGRNTRRRGAGLPVSRDRGTLR